MGRSRWNWLGSLAVAATATAVEAQERNSILPAGCLKRPGWIVPLQNPAPTVEYGTILREDPAPSSANTTPSDTSTPSESSGDVLGDIGAYKGAAGMNTVAVAGSGLGAATDAAVVSIPPQVPGVLILPGLLTAADAQAARPLDRVFFNYAYYNRFRVRRTEGFTDGAPFAGVPPLQSNIASAPRVTNSGFNLHRFDVGLEKTLFGGRASVYFRAPFLDATDNNTGQGIDGLGDVSGGFKVLLLDSHETGSALSAGFTVAAPTGRDTIFTTQQTISFDSSNRFISAVPKSTITLNPTYLQPYLSGVWVMDRFAIHNYLGVIIPDDDRVATFVNNDLGISYDLYRAGSDQLVRSITPTLDVQFLLPTNHRGTSPLPMPIKTGNFPPPDSAAFGFSDQIFLTPGLQLGIGSRALFSTQVIIPVSGPRAFDIGATTGLNFLF